MDLTRATARAIVAQLTAFHSPEDLRVAVSAGGDRLRHWDYVKWLPHAQHPEEYDAAGTKRLVSDDWNELERLLGGKEFDERGRFEPAAIPSESEPFVVLVLDGARISGSHRLGGPSYRNLIVIDVDGSLPWDGADTTLRLVLTTDAMEKVSINDSGDEERVRIGRPDMLSLIRARAVARQLAPYRLGGTASQSAESMSIAADLASLLGIRDLRTMDPDELWKARTAWDHLRIPIGRTATGQTLELDLKESAQGGMGPHGIMIGATGSGKSETIRTIVLALALTHSSEKLNLVLVDFKGGATFLGLDSLPHVSAVINGFWERETALIVDNIRRYLAGALLTNVVDLEAGY